MITVAEAEQIIFSSVRHYGTDSVPFTDALGFVLAEDLFADRDLPPYNRVTMDGIAIAYTAFEKGIRSYSIKTTQAAGDHPADIASSDECIEIMTGAALPASTDTVIRYEDLEIKKGTARIIVNKIKKGQNIHRKGTDQLMNNPVVESGRMIDPVVINMAATVGKTSLAIHNPPRVLIVSSGDEIVEVDQLPGPYQIRRSNNYAIQAELKKFRLTADMMHLPDNLAIIEQRIADILKKYDVIILSGGISMGKFDHIPTVLEKLSVTRLFHKVKQRPGKPFWFGKFKEDCLVFALPGNPVSAFMCLHRFFIPWLKRSLGLKDMVTEYAILNEDVIFNPNLQYFLQVKLSLNKDANLTALPVTGNGSGDFFNLVGANAFMELPMEQNTFRKGDLYRIWKF